MTDVMAPLVAVARAPIVFIVGAHGTMEYIDARGAAFVGRPPADVCGRSWFHLVHPDDVEAVRAAWKQARTVKRCSQGTQASGSRSARMPFQAATSASCTASCARSPSRRMRVAMAYWRDVDALTRTENAS